MRCFLLILAQGNCLLSLHTVKRPGQPKWKVQQVSWSLVILQSVYTCLSLLPPNSYAPARLINSQRWIHVILNWVFNEFSLLPEIRLAAITLSWAWNIGRATFRNIGRATFRQLIFGLGHSTYLGLAAPDGIVSLCNLLLKYQRLCLAIPLCWPFHSPGLPVLQPFLETALLVLEYHKLLLKYWRMV